MLTKADREVFLPKERKEGYIGFYPARPEEWQRLPLPLRASTSYPIANAGHVKAVIFDCYHDELSMPMEVSIHPQNVFKALFCFVQHPQMYTITAVVMADGSRWGAKWRQDQRTGAFAVYAGGYLVLKQGG